MEGDLLWETHTEGSPWERLNESFFGSNFCLTDIVHNDPIACGSTNFWFPSWFNFEMVEENAPPVMPICHEEKEQIQAQIEGNCSPLPMRFRPVKFEVEALEILIKSTRATIQKKEKAFRRSDREELHVCSKCERTFSQKSALSSHERVHNGEKPYACSFNGCSKSFSQLTNLRNHTRKHIGGRPFMCTVFQCGKSFTTNQNLVRHIKAHASLREFRCDVCRKSFGQRTHLKTHKKIFCH